MYLCNAQLKSTATHFITAITTSKASKLSTSEDDTYKKTDYPGGLYTLSPAAFL